MVLGLRMGFVKLDINLALIVSVPIGAMKSMFLAETIQHFEVNAQRNEN